MSELFSRAEAWQSHDPNAADEAELAALIAAAKGGDSAAIADLTERFVGPLEFGTAGLRGVIGAGESRMNEAVIVRTTLGLATHLLKTEPEAKTRGVVVGYDGRRRSREFAEATASVLARAGIRVYLSPRPCPTPLTAFAVTHYGAAAGVMVTASHNPPQYNGYKVYAGNGAQIIEPTDRLIASAIAEGPAANKIPTMDLAEARKQGLVTDLADEVEDLYVARVLALRLHPNENDRSMPIVYTPLHGVGLRLVTRVMAEAGFTGLTVVAEQAEPDGAFPTVDFPNPEEKGAMDLSLALAKKAGAELIIANDPDVDRLAIAVRRPDGEYTQLTGNQVGVLLAHYLLTESAKTDEKRLVLCSLVSSPMLGVIASNLGVAYEETLTGFKWIANRAMEIEAETGARFVFGYEEALGYTAGTVVRDKDGIGAALLMAELYAARRAQGESLLGELDLLARRYGLFVSGQKSVTFPGAQGSETMAAIMSGLRASPPAELDGKSVVAVRDLIARTRTPLPPGGGAPEPIALPVPSNVLIFELEGGSRVIARPSGTEPKLKYYVDVREPVGEGESIEAATARASATMAALTKAIAG